MSYYEKITENWDRLTDERWKQDVWDDKLPERPDWTNIYLADKQGRSKAQGRELPGRLFVGNREVIRNNNNLVSSLGHYPNPVSGFGMINFKLSAESPVSVSVYDATGRKVKEISNKLMLPGEQRIEWNSGSLNKGLYFCVIQAGQTNSVMKILVQ
jgi:hypothetical protein